VIKICVFGICGGGPYGPGEIPLGGVVGVGGSATATTGALNITTLGAPWIAGPVMIPDANGSHQVFGFAHGPASSTSMIGPGGVIQLVTPMQIRSLLDNPTAQPETLYATTRLNLVFTPEPGTLVLIGSGFAAVAWGGARRRRN